MDHGADCINTGLSAMTFLQLIKADNIWMYIAFVFLYQIFFLMTLEEYFYGSLDLPIINAVNEGSTGICLFLILGAFMGNEVYHTEVIWNIKIYQWLFIFLYTYLGLNSIYLLIKIWRDYGFKEAAQKNLLFFYINISFFVVILFGKNSEILTEHKIIMYIFTILFSKITISLIISHIFRFEYSQVQIFPFLIATLLIILVPFEVFFIESNQNC